MCVGARREGIETEYLHIREPRELGEQIGEWRICWLGGWDRMRVFYVVMVVRVKADSRATGRADPKRPPAA